MREEFDGPLAFKQDGAWMEANPAKWIPRESATVRVGMSPGERARKGATLQQMLGYQVELANQGMDDILVNARGFYATLMDWARVSDVPLPEKYWIDPDTKESQQALQSKQQQAADTAKMQQNLMAQAVSLEQIREALDKYKHDSELQFKYFAEVLGAEVEEAKIVGKATTDLAKQQMEGGARDGDDETSGPKRGATAGNGSGNKGQSVSVGSAGDD
jgi:hypothetical protein